MTGALDGIDVGRTTLVASVPIADTGEGKLALEMRRLWQHPFGKAKQPNFSMRLIQKVH